MSKKHIIVQIGWNACFLLPVEHIGIVASLVRVDREYETGGYVNRLSKNQAFEVHIVDALLPAKDPDPAPASDPADPPPKDDDHPFKTLMVASTEKTPTMTPPDLRDFIDGYRDGETNGGEEPI